MRRAVGIVALWGGLIVLLLVLEIAELSHSFTLPVESVLGNPITFVTVLLFTTLLAVVGAIFIGLYISHWLLAPRGFSPFEQEMLKMRREVQEVRAAVEDLRRSRAPAAAPPPADPRSRERP